jgi:hypothetical protein
MHLNRISLHIALATNSPAWAWAIMAKGDA